jgi:adenylate kinase family enzyme
MTIALQDDVRHNGWVLVGFPNSSSQAAALASVGIKPAAVIHLNISGKYPLHPFSLSPSLHLLIDEAAEERCAGRIVDARGRRWHKSAYPPPAGSAVSSLARDAPDSVRARLRAYAPLAGASCEVDGGQAPLDVLQDVLKALP